MASMAEAMVLRGIHAAARAGSRTRVPDDGLALLLADRMGDELPITLEGRNDVQFLAVLMTGADRPPIDHQAGPVQSAHGDEAAGHVLIAARNGDIGVIPLRVHHRLDGVGNQVARLQRIAHAIGAHRDAIAHPDGVEAQANHAGGGYAFLHFLAPGAEDACCRDCLHTKRWQCPPAAWPYPAREGRSHRAWPATPLAPWAV